MLRTTRVSGDKRQVDRRRGRARKLDLGLLGGFVESLERHLVLRQVDALLPLELGGHPVDDGLVEVVATEVVVTSGRLDLEHTVTDFEHRDVKRPAAEVEDEDRFVGVLVEAIGERRGRRLVDDAFDVKPGDLAGVLRCLALRVIEVGRHGNHGRVDGLTEECLGVSLQLLQDHRADFLGAVLLVARVDPRVAVRSADHGVGHHGQLFVDLGELATHEPLDTEDGVLWICDRLAPSDRAHETLAALGKANDRRRGATALGVWQHLGLATCEDRDARVRGTEVNADRLAHVVGAFLGREARSKEIACVGSMKLES